MAFVKYTNNLSLDNFAAFGLFPKKYDVYRISS